MKFNEIQLTSFSLKKDVIGRGDCFILSFPSKPPLYFFKKLSQSFKHLWNRNSKSVFSIITLQTEDVCD